MSRKPRCPVPQTQAPAITTSLSSSSPLKSRMREGHEAKALYVWFLANEPSQNTLYTSYTTNSNEPLNCHIGYAAAPYSADAAPNTRNATW